MVSSKVLTKKLKMVLSRQIEYLSAMENKITIAQANSLLDEKGKFLEDLVSCRENLNFYL